DFDRCHMLGRDVDVLEDRVHRTDDLALFAVDTDFGVDIELWRARRCMDTGDRTDLDAGSIVRAQARDDIRHFVLASLGDSNYRFQITYCSMPVWNMKFGIWNGQRPSRPPPAASRCGSR